MEIEKRIAKIEGVPFQIAKVAGAFLAAMAAITIGVFEFAKLVKYLWLSF